ncbi:jg8100, partial [Pararge aegeria aegeria]
PNADCLPALSPPRLRPVTATVAEQRRSVVEGRESAMPSSPGRPVSAMTDRDASGTDRIIEAIRSINTTVRSNQSYYISNFDPSIHDIDIWCEEVDRAKSTNYWNDNECLSRIGNCLKGDARTWLNEWVTNDRSWSNFKKEFKPLCPRTPDIANILYEVMSSNSDKYPTYADYSRRSLLKLRIVRGLSDELISAIVIRGITDPQIRASATNAKLMPNEIVEFFSIYVKSNTSSFNRKSGDSISYDRLSKSNYDAKIRKRRFEEGICFSCGQRGHTQSRCSKKSKAISVKSNNEENNKNSAQSLNKSEPCAFCRKPGHKIETCFAKLKSDSRNTNNI